MYVVYDGAREKTHSVITLFFVCYLWWSKRKNSFCYDIFFSMSPMMEQQKKWFLKSSFCDNIIFSMLSMIEEDKQFILLEHYFLYAAYGGGREKVHSFKTLFSYVSDGVREKSHFVITLFSLSCLWWSKRKSSFGYHINFCILFMTKEEKKWVLKSSFCFKNFFFVCFLWYSKRKKISFSYNIIFCMLFIMKQ